MNTSTLRRVLVAVSRAYVFVACVGLSAALLLALVDALSGGPRESFSGKLRSVPYYSDKPWTEQFIRDQDQIGLARVRYAPFTVWRRPPYQSETVNIDADGLRVIPGADRNTSSPKIWFFGGSTMWGTDSPDSGTIPAQFCTIATQELHTPLCVRNFGESAWVSTQSMIALIQQLQRGNVPEVVIFYHGANDLLWAFSNSQPYQHAAFQQIASQMNRTGRGRGRQGLVQRDFSDLLAFIAPGVKARWDKARFSGGWPQDDSPDALARLARETVDVCLTNHRIVQSLAEDFGFEARFFWQPSLMYDRKPLAAAEQDMLRQAGRWGTTFRGFASAANACVAANLTSEFVDLSNCFSGCEDQLYTDIGHVTPEANALIAREIFEVVRPRLEAGGRRPTPRRE